MSNHSVVVPRRIIRHATRHTAGAAVTGLCVGGLGFLVCTDPTCRDVAEDALTAGLHDQQRHVPITPDGTLSVPISITASNAPVTGAPTLGFGQAG